MSIQNNRGYNNIEDTGRLMTRNKRAGAAKIIVIVLVILIILALIITGVYFFLQRNKKDVASETITADEIRGTYYTLMSYTDDIGDYPYMVDVKEDIFRIYCSVDPYGEEQYYYRLRDEDKKTIIEFSLGTQSEYASLAYYKDLGILWIGGGEFYDLMFRENDRRYDYAVSFMKRYYSDNDSADRYFKGKWRDAEDSNNCFEFTDRGVSSITVSEFNWDNLDMTRDSELYSYNVTSIGYEIAQNTNIKHNDDGSISYSTKYHLSLVPISDDECLAYYSDYSKGNYLTSGTGTIFERVSD